MMPNPKEYGAGRIGSPPPLAVPAGENEVSKRLYRVLLKWIRYAKEQYAEWPERPGSGHFFGGAYWYGIETGYTALIFAVAAKLGDYDEGLTGQTRDSIRDKAIGAIRYLVYTHDTGPAECVRVESRNPYCSGKKWGGHGDPFFRASQTGTVVHALCCAAWLLWDDLDDETKQRVEAVAVYYADRWSEEEPRNGVYIDTQCEENGWTSAGIGTAAAMFPEHPRSGVWREAAQRWALNSVTTPTDKLLYRSKGVSTVTFHPDYTSENHAFVHPSYMMAGIYLRGFYALLLRMSGQPVPGALTSNNVPMYDATIKRWSMNDGMAVPVQGQDWWYNRQHEALMCHSFMHMLHQDPDAALLERRALQFIENIQASNSKGCMLEEDGESCIIVAESFQTAKDMEFGSAHSLVISYLLHRYGEPASAPADSDVFNRRMEGVHEYPYGCSIVHRTKTAFSAFSWRSHVMGVTMPERGMWAVTPIYSSYTGEVEFEDEPPGHTFNETKSIEASESRIHRYGDGFGATAAIMRGRGGKLRQDVGFVSLPNGASFYAERIRVMQPCAIKRLQTGIIGLRNEHYAELKGDAAGAKLLHMPNGTKRYEGFYGKEPNVLERLSPADFVNVDDEIGYVLFGSAGMTYLNQHDYPKWKGVEDILTLNARFDMRFGAPADLPAFAVLTLPNRTAGETAKEASRTALLTGESEACLVAETDEYLIVINFGDSCKEAKVTSPLSGSSPIRLFEGVQGVTSSEVERYINAQKGEARYAKCRFQLELDAPLANAGALEAVVSGGRVWLHNETSGKLGCVVVDCETGKRAAVTLEAGRTEAVKPE